MKLLNQIFKLFILVLFTSNFVFAQETPPPMFVVHTDYVNFNKMAQYEQLAKELKDNCVEHNVQKANWLTVSTEDGRYMYVSEIKNMAELDENTMSELFEKMGNDGAGAMFSKMNECYDKHSDQIVHYIPELSYNPDGYSRDGMNFREYHFLYYHPQNGEALGNAMESVKKMFEAKGIKNGYNVYHSGFGSDENYFMVSVSGKNSLDVAQTGEENDALLGDERKEVFFEMIQLASRYDQVNGEIRPDLSYSPKKE